jgi:hypothetical protein
MLNNYLYFLFHVILQRALLGNFIILSFYHGVFFKIYLVKLEALKQSVIVHLK